MPSEASSAIRNLSMPLKELFIGLVLMRGFFCVSGLKLTSFGLKDLVCGSHAKKLAESVSLFSFYDLFLAD